MTRPGHVTPYTMESSGEDIGYQLSPQISGHGHYLNIILTYPPREVCWQSQLLCNPSSDWLSLTHMPISYLQWKLERQIPGFWLLWWEKTAFIYKMRIPWIKERDSVVVQLCLTLCNPMDCRTPGFPVLHHLAEFAQTHVHWVCDAIEPSHPLLPLSPPARNLSQHQCLFQCWHQVVKLLEL